MAHEITSRDTFGYAGQPAWHGLGLEVPANSSVKEGFQHIGLTWSTELLPLTTTIMTPVGMSEIVLPEHKVHRRTDLEGPESVLGVVSNNYAPVTNEMIAEFADAICGLDAAPIFETGGSLRGGKRVFTLIKLPRSIEITRDDIVDCYICLSNGNDGLAAFCVYPTSIRVVCANTLRMSQRDVSRGITFHHTGDMSGKLAQARQALGFVLTAQEKFEADARTLVDMRLTGESLEAYLTLVQDKTYGKLKEPKRGTASIAEIQSHERKLVKRREQIQRWTELATADPRQCLPGVEGSAWAAVNAVTQYHDHERGRFKSVSDSEGRAHSNLFGASNKDKTIAWKTALQLANA